jgi:hypothetical protein
MKRTLEDVRNELEEAVVRLGGGDLQGEELYQLYEMLAIQILDSEHDEFEQGELELFLRTILESLK